MESWRAILENRSVLVTGGTGFVGGAVLSRLAAEGQYITAVVRDPLASLPGTVRMIVVPDFDVVTDWSDVLQGCGVIIHSAARTHVMNDQSIDPLAEFRKVNVDCTLNLARQAATAGIKRFIFISSIKVNGEGTPLGKPYNASDAPAPEDAYGQSKQEAEQGLVQLASETGMEVVIIRPPLVYGPGVKGNFASMIKLVEKGLPLPLGAIHNKRSLVGIDNLVDLIICCIDHPAAANQVFLAGDGEDLSTTELLGGVGKAMGKPARLIPLPTGLLQFGARLLGKKAMAQRLLGSLQVDISKTCELLDWKPPYTVQEGLRRCFTTGKD
ncbi:UDP-glucose 4-epimerase family protein [Phytopseudomonas dryadis]|uniref:Nucleoside-diphosphate sugar epimerase n=1 Tax=Phytopseudomonas dryadis TaxID=2487520 RepID=A0ABY1ZDI9_9GAMM|nr:MULTISPECIES: SDR family oxidoreductase [Pseudomonas]TBV08274.1 nucleoside-diphosphate sugar epimerase [Pseudomonas dryadis]TBV19724.1 nucleoside-diphosphate sugar epimerase [Pseudomonas sp. FRB 230]